MKLEMSFGSMTHKNLLSGWSPYVVVYDPIKAGSIDGTDVTPHDHAVYRAISAVYHPPDETVVTSNPEHTLFVGRLDPRTSQKAVEKEFSHYGKVRSCKVVKDIVTGASRGYAFVEFDSKDSAERAWRKAHHTVLDGRQVVVEWEFARSMPGWVPRRLGDVFIIRLDSGGLGGRKESGQLRFGGRDRPFKKPIILKSEQQETTSQGILNFDRPDKGLYESEKRSRDGEILRQNTQGGKGCLPSDSKGRKKDVFQDHEQDSFGDDLRYRTEYNDSSSYYKSRRGQVSDRYDKPPYRKDHYPDGSSAKYKKDYHFNSYDDFRDRRKQYYKSGEGTKFRTNSDTMEEDNDFKYRKNSHSKSVDSEWDSWKQPGKDYKKHFTKDSSRKGEDYSARSHSTSRYHHTLSRSSDHTTHEESDKSNSRSYRRTGRGDSPEISYWSSQKSTHSASDNSKIKTDCSNVNHFYREVPDEAERKPGSVHKRKYSDEKSPKKSPFSSSDSEMSSDGERKKHKKHKRKKKKKEKKKKKKKRSKSDSDDS